MNIIVIGGGAAGFFSAINIAEKCPSARVQILEKSAKIMQKIKVSGGGRCNVTNGRKNPSELTKFYPRGERKLKKPLSRFGSKEMIEWLELHRVETHVEDDFRVFPRSNSSQTIIDAFLHLAHRYKIEIIPQQNWTDIRYVKGLWEVETTAHTFTADKVIIATGSSPQSIKTLNNLGLASSNLVPSLFTFNIQDLRIEDLQGLSFDNTTVRITNSKLKESGPLLITHWGLSGPVILKLSARGAYDLHHADYQFEILINWVSQTPQNVESLLLSYKNEHPKRKVINYPLFELPKNFWIQLCTHAGLKPDLIYAELSKKHLHKLTEDLAQGRFKVNGKSTFKEEFVTAGGISLSEININTFECRNFPGLYIAGELLDIDGITGGFNFQACWTAGWHISEHLKYSH